MGGSLVHKTVLVNGAFCGRRVVSANIARLQYHGIGAQGHDFCIGKNRCGFRALSTCKCIEAGHVYH